MALAGGYRTFRGIFIYSGRQDTSAGTGVELSEATQVGIIEYPSHYLNGLDSPAGVAFKVDEYRGGLRINHEASEAAWFSTVPDMIHADLDSWLISHNYLLRASPLNP